MSAVAIGGLILLLSCSISSSIGGGYYYNMNVITTSNTIKSNCEVSEWSAWGQCVDGKKTRTRTVTKQGDNCPQLTDTQSCSVNCEVSTWSNWGYCTDGTQTRTRVVTKQGDNCPPLTETQNCPVNCEVSGWSDWGPCNNGTKTRTRTVTKDPKNNGTACPMLTETQNCPVNCEVSGWSNWGPTCSKTNRTQSRTRTVTKGPKNNGTACPPLTESRACPENPFSWDPFLLYNTSNKTCLFADPDSSKTTKPVRAWDCGNQLWTYNPETQQLKYKENGACISMVGGYIRSEVCDSGKQSQKWTYDKTSQTLKNGNGCTTLFDNQNDSAAMGSTPCPVGDTNHMWRVVAPDQVSSLEKPVRATADNFKTNITVIDRKTVKVQSPDIPVGNDTDLLYIGLSVAGSQGDMVFGRADGIKPSQLRAGYTFTNLNLPIDFHGKDWEVYYSFKGFGIYGGKFTFI